MVLSVNGTVLVLPVDNTVDCQLVLYVYWWYCLFVVPPYVDCDVC